MRLKGDTGKRGDQTRKYGALESIAPPSWLDREGKAWWRRVAPPLAEDGLLNPVTVDLLATAAAAWSTYRDAAKKLTDQGRVIVTHTGSVKPNPWLAVEKQAHDTLLRVYRLLDVSGPVAPVGDDLELFLADEP